VSSWVIELRGAKWSKALRSARAFESPEAAVVYAHALIDEPEIWYEGEGWALCRLLEAEDPEKIEFLVTHLD